jgi:hypothetical protein
MKRLQAAALAAALLAAALAGAQPPAQPRTPDRQEAVRAEGLRAFAALQEAKTELQGRLLAAEAAKTRLREASDAAEQADAHLRRAAAAVAERQAAVEKIERELERYEGAKDAAQPGPAVPRGGDAKPEEDKLDRVLKRLDDLDKRMGALERAAKK